MNEIIGIFLDDKFPREEAEKIKRFVDQGFSFNGQVAIASIFAYARQYDVSVDEALAACQEEWERHWKFQHPEIMGDPEAPGSIGPKNFLALQNVYERLGIPLPAANQ